MRVAVAGFRGERALQTCSPSHGEDKFRQDLRLDPVVAHVTVGSASRALRSNVAWPAASIRYIMYPLPGTVDA
jgi:hypothetical protein